MKKFALIFTILFVVIGVGYATDISYNNTKNTLSAGNILEEEKENARMYFEMAKMYSKSNDHENAIKYYTKVIELYPNFEPAYIGRAKDYGDMGNYQGSLKDCETLKKLHPNDPVFYWATSLYKTNTKDLEGAMEDIDKALSMVKKPDASYYAQKAWVYLEMKDYVNTIKWAKKALKQNPQDEYTLGLITVMAFESNRYEDVLEITDILKYGKYTKDNHALMSLRAKALFQLGKKEEAIRQMDDAIKLAPDKKEYLQLKEKMQKDEKIQ